MDKKTDITTNQTLAQLLTASSPTDEPKPLLINLRDSADRAQLQKLINDKHVIIRDTFAAQLKELCAIKNPSLPQTSSEFANAHKKIKQEVVADRPPWQAGMWIYFPWLRQLVHTVTKVEYDRMRTNRNQNLITRLEQKKLLQFTVGIAGLSIGNSIALGLACNGIGNAMKLAEHDVLEISNLNRIRAGIDKVGIAKINITAQQIYEVNPYAQLTLFNQGLSTNTLSEFVTAEPKPKVIFEAIDDIEMKIRLRIKARSARIPVIMITNLGDRLLIDVERYDINNKIPLFNGLIGNTPEEVIGQPDVQKDVNKYAIKIVGLENLPKRALQSVHQINQTLVGRPQLMSTVTIGSGVANYLARRIALGKSVPSGRKLVKFDEVFN